MSAAIIYFLFAEESFVSSYLEYLGMSVEAWTQPGAAWDSWVSDVTLVSVSGVSYPMFNGQALGGSPWSPGAGSTFAMSTDTDSAVGTRYYLDDHLGTTQMELSAGGWPVWQGSFTPFGQEIIGGSTTNYLGQQPQDGTAMRYKFTGKERDTESGLDYFGARYYASNMGRFTSPDWSAQEEPVPYAKLGDPQSLNLYDYVGNNPLSRGDPDGHRSTIGIHSEFQFAEIGTNQVDPVFNTPAGWAVSNGLGAYGTPDPPAQQQNTQQAAAGNEPDSTVSKVMNNPTVEKTLENVSTFASGAADFMTFGLTKKINKMDGGADFINYDSKTYTAGKITGITIGVADIAATGLTAAALRGGKAGAVFGRGGKALLNTGPVRFGWYWTGTRDAIGLRLFHAPDSIHIPFFFPKVP